MPVAVPGPVTPAAPRCAVTAPGHRCAPAVVPLRRRPPTASPGVLAPASDGVLAPAVPPGALTPAPPGAPTSPAPAGGLTTAASSGALPGLGTRDLTAACAQTRRVLVERRWLVAGVLLLLAGAVVSVFVGVTDVSLPAVLADEGHARAMLWYSRLPRTAAILLAGSAAAVAGVVLQMLVRNRFVEPSTVGTTESAQLGLLAVTILAPAMPLPGRLAIASATAVGGTLLFLAVLRAVPIRSTVTVPLVGLMLGGVIGAVTAFIAFHFDLMQTLGAWITGDFSGVIAGRFELLWLVGVLAVVVYLLADRFTVIGLGRDVATSLGLGYRGVLALGLTMVAVTSAVVVVVVGGLPFLGLVVPNVVSMLLGDNLRRSLPWVALGGAGLVLVCDLIARLVAFPFEVPIGAVMGVLGAAIFLTLLLRKGARVG